MPKQNPLSRGLKQKEISVESRQPAKTIPKSRAGKVLIGGHFAPEVQTELKVIAAQERTTIQSLIAEGINAVLARRHKPQIADLTPTE